jgi:hypothetical protein
MVTISEDAKFNSEEAENMTPRRLWGVPLTFGSNNTINTVGQMYSLLDACCFISSMYAMVKRAISSVPLLMHRIP